MLVWKQWRRETYYYGKLTKAKEYKLLLLFGFIPVFISING